MGKVFFEVWNIVYVLINFIFMISIYLKMRAFIKFGKVLMSYDHADNRQYLRSA
jgi:hypothetical protein